MKKEKTKLIFKRVIDGGKLTKKEIIALSTIYSLVNIKIPFDVLFVNVYRLHMINFPVWNYP